MFEIFVSIYPSLWENWLLINSGNQHNGIRNFLVLQGCQDDFISKIACLAASAKCSPCSPNLWCAMTISWFTEMNAAKFVLRLESGEWRWCFTVQRLRLPQSRENLAGNFNTFYSSKLCDAQTSISTVRKNLVSSEISWCSVFCISAFQWWFAGLFNQSSVISV